MDTGTFYSAHCGRVHLYAKPEKLPNFSLLLDAVQCTIWVNEGDKHGPKLWFTAKCRRRSLLRHLEFCTDNRLPLLCILFCLLGFRTPGPTIYSFWQITWFALPQVHRLISNLCDLRSRCLKTELQALNICSDPRLMIPASPAVEPIHSLDHGIPPYQFYRAFQLTHLFKPHNHFFLEYWMSSMRFSSSLMFAHLRFSC